MMNTKKFFLPAALLVICFGAHLTNAAPARRLINKCETIDESGSYLLARNLTATGDCLVLAADNVTIDLNGFTIEGDGSGGGIKDNAAARRNITIRNGVITNFHSGIELSNSSSSTVEGIRAVKNTFAGIRSGSNAIIRHSIVNDNGNHGIFANKGSLVTDNVVNNNGAFGIKASCASNIIGNSVTGSGVQNIVTGGAGCTFYNNNPAP